MVSEAGIAAGGLWFAWSLAKLQARLEMLCGTCKAEPASYKACWPAEFEVTLLNCLGVLNSQAMLLGPRMLSSWIRDQLHTATPLVAAAL